MHVHTDLHMPIDLHTHTEMYIHRYSRKYTFQDTYVHQDTRVQRACIHMRTHMPGLSSVQIHPYVPALRVNMHCVCLGPSDTATLELAFRTRIWECINIRSPKCFSDGLKGRGIP